MALTNNQQTMASVFGRDLAAARDTGRELAATDISGDLSALVTELSDLVRQWNDLYGSLVADDPRPDDGVETAAARLHAADDKIRSFRSRAQDLAGTLNGLGIGMVSQGDRRISIGSEILTLIDELSAAMVLVDEARQILQTPAATARVARIYGNALRTSAIVPVTPGQRPRIKLRRAQPVH
jgi:hypothetical protein